MRGGFAGHILLYGICVYIVRTHRGEVSHKEYSSTEYEYATGREFAGYIPAEYIHVVCSQGGEFFHLDYSSSKYSYAMCSHEGEHSPGIFLYGIKTPCIVTGVSFLTRTVPLWKIYTP